MAHPDASVVRAQARTNIIAIVCVMVGMLLGGLIGNGFQARTTGPLSVGEGIGLVVGTLAGVAVAALVSRSTLVLSPAYGLTLVGAKVGDRLGGEGAAAWGGWLAGGVVGLLAGLVVMWLVVKAIPPPKPEP